MNVYHKWHLPLRYEDLTALSVVVLGLSVLIGYALDYRPAFRLTPHTPGIYPLSALCLVLLGFGFYAGRREGPILQLSARVAVFTAVSLAALRVMTPAVSTSLFYALTPFKSVLMVEAAAGRPIVMALHSAHVLLLLVLAEILRREQRPALSQAVACGTVSLLLMGIMGYTYGLPDFYGTMAYRTIAGAMLLALSLLCATRDHGFIRPLIAPSEPGRVARLLLGISTPLILIIGWLTVHYTRTYGLSGEASALIAYQTAAIVILSWFLVIGATIRSDIIDRHRCAAEAALLHVARTDALTGLLSRNRLDFYRFVDQHGKPLAQTAELLIGLDRFRTVNDVFGDVVGDEFLIEIGRRLLEIGNLHHVGRMGGDKFSIVCSGVTLEEATQIGSGVTETLAVPFRIRERSFYLTGSVGIAHSNTAGDTRLQAAANSAMHVARGRGGNQVVIFEGSMFEDRRSRIELEQHLYDALKQDGAFTLAFQPIVGTDSQLLVAVEALARWTHADLGPVPPGRFIEVAEQSGLIIPLGSKLMRIAVAQAAAWRDRYGSGAPRINLNISPIQFGVGDVVGDLKRCLSGYGLLTRSICIEVTEGAFSDAHAVLSLQKARDMGFAVAMDDFGVGYSSLSQLPRLPISSVKLDRSFIIDATESAGGVHLLSSIVQLAHGLDLKLVAEGVETPSQHALVAEVGCDAMQGYLTARPMRPEDFQIWFEERVAMCS